MFKRKITVEALAQEFVSIRREKKNSKNYNFIPYEAICFNIIELKIH